MENFGQVGASDYAGLAGFGSGGLSVQALENLNKALTAGSSINAPGSAVAGDGFALRVESLEQTLINQTFRMEHIRLWKALTKRAAFNTVEEFNTISSYGAGDTAFVAAGALPPEEDSTYKRNYAVIKFMGTTRKVDHPMTLVKPAHGPVIAQETVAGTMHLLRMVEKALFEADSALSALQFDGFRALITANSPTSNVVDLRGQPMDEDKLIDGALTLQDSPNWANPTHIHMNPKVKADLVKTLFPKNRYDGKDRDGGAIFGMDASKFVSPAGDVQFEPNSFIDDGGAPPAAAGGQVGLYPGSPVISTGATTPVSALSKFVAADVGTYSYWISAHNDYGHSAAVAVSASEAIAAGDEYTAGVTPADAATKWYQLYRTKSGVTGIANARLIARIPNAAGAGATTIHDYNDKIPFTTEVYMWQQTPDVMDISQLAPFLKIPLATVDATIRWMQLLYFTPRQKAPGKMLMYKNVGRSAGFVGAP